jgi:galactonate dehydratase
MKIKKIDIMQLEHLNDEQASRPIGCRIYTDEGIYGDGEAALAYGCASDAAFGQLKEFSRIIIGMNALNNEQIWDKLYKSTFWGQNGGPVIFSAISAIDIALWDIKGKFFNAPIHALLGGKRRNTLRAYASQLQFGWGHEKKDKLSFCFTADQFAQVTKDAIADGFDAIKIDYIMTGSELDRSSIASEKWLSQVEDCIAATREAAGPNVDIILENHSMTTVLPGVEVGRRAEKYKIFYYEEVCTPEPKLMKYVHENVKIPIASGERIYTRWQYRPYLEDMSLQVIQPDLGTCGGFTETKKICDMAYTYDIAVQLHTCHTSLSTAAALHLEAVIPNFLIHEDNDHGTLHPRTYDSYCTVNYLPVSGYFTVPDLPGLGTEWSEETMATSTIVTIS